MKRVGIVEDLKKNATVESNTAPNVVKKSERFANVIPAPQWLKDRMARLRALPPPTLEEVRTAWAASANWEFDCVKEIRKAKYIR